MSTSEPSNKSLRDSHNTHIAKRIAIARVLIINVRMSDFFMRIVYMDVSKEDVASLIMCGFTGSRVSQQTVKDAAELLKQRKVGGFIVTGSGLGKNFGAESLLIELGALMQSSPPDGLAALISVDMEGGSRQPLQDAQGFDVINSAATMPDAVTGTATTEYQSIARQLRKCGITWNFAPVVDTKVDGNPVISGLDRAFSADVNTITEYANIVVAKHRDNDVLTCLKHFPGHGSTVGLDTHHGGVDISTTWNESELEPYKSVACPAVMLGHLSIDYDENTRPWGDSVYPASLSKNIIDNLLRDEDGIDFQGLVISDALEMDAIDEELNLTYAQAASMAIRAGNDIALFVSPFNDETLTKPLDLDGIVDHVHLAASTDAVLRQRIIDANAKVKQLRRSITVPEKIRTKLLTNDATMYESIRNVLGAKVYDENNQAI